MKQELDRCKHRFKQIIGALPCAYVFGEVFVDGKGEPTDYAVREVNHSFTEVTGLTKEKILGKRIEGLFSMATVRDDIEIFSRVAVTGDPVEREFLSPYFGIHFRLFCFSPEKGTFVALLTDLSIEKKYRERVEFLSDFANSTSDEFFILDSSGRFVLGNRAVSRKLGLQQSELLGRKISSLNPTAEDQWWDTLWASLLQKGTLQFETEHRGADGQLYPVELSVDLMVNGGQSYAAVVSKNIGSRRTLSTALLRDQKYAEQAASRAGYTIWTVDSSGFFRPILGGDSLFTPGPVESALLALVHPDDRVELYQKLSGVSEGLFDFRLKTDRGLVYHRASWSRAEDECITGICYPLSGSGFAGSGSSSSAMDTYCLMVEAMYKKTMKLKESLEGGNLPASMKIVNSFSSEFAVLTGQSPFSERVRFDAFLQSNGGMLKQLLGSAIPLEIQTFPGAAGLIDPTLLENVLVRLLLIIQKTGKTAGASLRPISMGGSAGVKLTVMGRDGIQKGLDELFIPVRDSVPGLASVYALVRSSGGRVVFETFDSTVEFSIWFPRAKMSDDSASVLIALPQSVDAARAYAALRDAGFSAAIETDCREIQRRISEERTGVLVASASMPDYEPCDLIVGLDDIALIQVGGRPPGGKVRYLPENFRTGELVFMVKEILSKAEKPRAEDLQDEILWAEPHLTPPLF